MISVIIPKNKQTKYVNRCVNAIYRQQYQDIQIIVITDQELDLSKEKHLEIINDKSDNPYSGLNEALQLAKGDYLLFVNLSSVLSSNVIELLLENTFNSPEWLYCARYYEKKESKYNQLDYDYTTIFGKLFSKKIVNDNNLTFDENSYLCCYLFQAQYCKYVKGTQQIKGVIYDSKSIKKDLHFAEQFSDVIIWKDYICSITELEKKICNSICDELCDRIIETDMVDKDIVGFAEKKFHNNYAFQKKIILPTVKKWWNDIILTNDDGLYTSFITYLTDYDDSEEYQMIILKECGLNKEKLDILRKYDYHNAKFFLENMSLLKDDIEMENEGKKPEDLRNNSKANENKNSLHSLEVKMDELCKSLESRTDAMNKDNNMNFEILTGVELERFAIDKYHNGQLGFRTIWKSFLAWIKYKI